MCEKNEPIVSVVLPLYNQERYIKASLRSICNQTYKNLEIIVVNDGSVDKSPQIVKQLAEKDNRIKVIDKENGGTSFARRDGYLNASGKYLAFVDNDDMLPLIFGSFPVGEVVHSPRLFDDYYIGFFRNSVFPINIWGRLFRKRVVDEAYERVELFSAQMPCMAGDEFFNLQVFPFLKSVYRIEDVVYYYRYGGTVNHFNRFFPEMFILSDIRLKLLDEFGYNIGYKPLFDEYVSSVYGYAAMMIHYNERDKNGVIDFFKDEINHREVMRRLLKYYKQNEIKRADVQLIDVGDFEAMYSRACAVERATYGTYYYKMKQILNRVLGMF